MERKETDREAKSWICRRERQRERDRKTQGHMERIETESQRDRGRDIQRVWMDRRDCMCL